MSAAIEARASESALKHNGADSFTFDNAGIQSGLGASASGAIFGLTLSNNVTDSAHDIDIAVGSARDAQDTVMMKLASVLTKQIDVAWAVGTNAGGLFSGSVAIDTWYHVFLIRKDSDGTTDAGFDTSVTAVNIPAGYTAYRRLGSVLTDASANIIQFVQQGNIFTLDTPITEFSSTAIGTRVTVTLSTPLGVKTEAILFGTLASIAGTSRYARITDLDVSDAVVSNVNCNVISSDSVAGYSHGNRIKVLTSTASQVGVRGSNTDANFSMYTHGWVDDRGQF